MAPKLYDIRVRRLQKDLYTVDVFTKTFDFDDETQLIGINALLVHLLAGAIKRSGGDVKDIDEYDLQLYPRGKGSVDMTFAAAASEVLDQDR